jgi:hypothetical protein
MNYRKIWEKYNGSIPKDEKGRSYDIHHIDGNRNNNDITNLKAVSLEEHWKIHFEQGDYLEANMIANRIGKELYYGWTHKDETKKKISNSHKGKKLTDEQRKKLSERQKGKPKSFRTDEHKKNLSNALKNKKVPKEVRHKMSESQKGKKRIVTESHKLNLSKALSGKKRSVESIEKQKLKQIGKKASEETRQKMKEAQQKRRHSI